MDLRLHQCLYPGQVSNRTYVSFTFHTILARTCGPMCWNSLHGFDSIISAILNQRYMCANGINWHPYIVVSNLSTFSPSLFINSQADETENLQEWMVIQKNCSIGVDPTFKRNKSSFRFVNLKLLSSHLNRKSMYGNGIIVHFLQILRQNILSKTIVPLASKRCSNYISIVIQNYSLVIAHISTSHVDIIFNVVF